MSAAGNQSSNVDSGRGSAAYSSGRKGPQVDTESSGSPIREDSKNDDSEWVDIVDAELRHILDPGKTRHPWNPHGDRFESTKMLTSFFLNRSVIVFYAFSPLSRHAKLIHSTREHCVG